MNIRLQIAAQIATGLLASEAGDDGPYYGETRTDPNTGKETYRQTVYPINPETKVEDYSKTQIPCPLRETRAQRVANEALAIADELIARYP